MLPRMVQEVEREKVDAREIRQVGVMEAERQRVSAREAMPCVCVRLRGSNGGRVREGDATEAAMCV